MRVKSTKFPGTLPAMKEALENTNMNFWWVSAASSSICKVFSGIVGQFPLSSLMWPWLSSLVCPGPTSRLPRTWACKSKSTFWINEVCKTLPKAQRTRGLSSAYQCNLFLLYLKFKNISWSNFILRILTKHQLQNLNQTSASLSSKYWPSLGLESRQRFNFITSTKHQRQNTDQTLP